MHDMTKGSVVNNLICHAFPIIVSSWLQIGYNAIDAIIVGRFIGDEALASEAIASPILNLLVLFVSGFTIGTGILMGEAFGKKDYEEFKKLLSSLMIFGLSIAIVVAFLLLSFMGQLLGYLKTPKEIFDTTRIYLSLSLISLPFTFLFNAISSALKSGGDSKTPLYFLLFSSILNAILDLLLIGLLGFGIVCSALTTVFSIFLSASLSFCYMARRERRCFPTPREMTFEKERVFKILSFGLPTALQQALQPIGKLFIQQSVNMLGVDGIASFQIGTNIDSFALIPEQSISSSCSFFIAQNRGKGDKKRISYGFFVALMMEIIYWLFYGPVVYLLREKIVSLFVVDSPNIVSLGSEYLSLMSLFYILPGLTNVVQGYFRGWAKTGVTLFGTLTQITIRTILTFILVPIYQIKGVAYSSALGWSVMLLWEGTYLIFHITKQIKDSKLQL